MEYLEMIAELITAAMEQWDGIEDIVIRLVDLLETITSGFIA